ncbi:hypothetical protein H0H87_006198 [Tephrocybe sp. NHM501043]|nr:hypothetical protein H0H87_006198 [Tephrocybe sp. NHM501043]
MLFISFLLLASFSGFPALAAPVPHHFRKRADGGGWPTSTDGDAQSSFGISGGFKDSFLKTIDGAPTLVAEYPKGSYAGANIAGWTFEASGGSSIDIESAREVKFSYQVKFPKGFDFVLAGKLPGLYGGENRDVATKCTGGHHDDKCWSARLMWRKDGEGELYAYLPTANQKLAICKGKCDIKYGASLGTGSWKFEPGEWTQLSERVKLNAVGKMDGEIEVFVGGKSVIHEKGISLRESDKGRIMGAMIHTFFGGSSSPDFASSKDQEAYFKDFKLEVTEKL